MRERDRPEKSRRVKGLSHVINKNNGRKGMQRPGKIENVKKKIHAIGERKVLQLGIGNFVWASHSGGG